MWLPWQQEKVYLFSFGFIFLGKVTKFQEKSFDRFRVMLRKPQRGNTPSPDRGKELATLIYLLHFTASFKNPRRGHSVLLWTEDPSRKNF